MTLVFVSNAFTLNFLEKSAAAVSIDCQVTSYTLLSFERVPLGIKTNVLSLSENAVFHLNENCFSFFFEPYKKLPPSAFTLLSIKRTGLSLFIVLETRRKGASLYKSILRILPCLK